MAKTAATKPAKAEKEPRVERKPTDLTENEAKVLTALAKSKTPMTRSDLRTRTGIKKGWSRLLGTPTKGLGEGVNGGKDMESRGLVKSHVPGEGERQHTYTITVAGKNALMKHS